MNGTGFHGALDDDLGQSVEERTLGVPIALLAVRIAVADPDEHTVAGYFEADLVVCRRHGPALPIEDLDLQNGDVLAVGVDCDTICGEPYRRRLSGGFVLLDQNNLAVLRAACFDHAWFIAHLPRHMAKARDLLDSLALPVDKQFHFVQVRINPDGNFAAFLSRPVPVWKQMQTLRLSPPGFVVVEIVLRETAHIHDAELRVDRRPPVRRWFPAIIKARPGEAARGPLARAIELPPALRRLSPRNHAVVTVHRVSLRVGGVLSARGDGAGGLGPIDRALGVFLVESIGKPLIVVEADNVESVGDALLITLVYSSGNHARRVELMAKAHHAASHLDSLLSHVVLKVSFLIANGPGDDRRRIAVAFDHQFELPHALRA